MDYVCQIPKEVEGDIHNNNPAITGIYKITLVQEHDAGMGDGSCEKLIGREEGWGFTLGAGS